MSNYNLILGAAGANVSFGTQGQDQIYGDPFTGGEGEAGVDNGKFLSSGAGGNDTIFGLGGADGLLGDAYQIQGFGHGGNDLLQGGAGGDIVFGDADNIYAHGVGGNDALYGDVGNDFLYGDSYFMGDQARGGDDVLVGSGGDDYLFGDSTASTAGTTGGHDSFVFAPGSGHDNIVDYEAGKDRIDIGGYHLAVHVFGLDTNADGRVDIHDAHTFSDGQNGLRLDLGAAHGAAGGVDMVDLQNVHSINDADFIA